MDDVPSGSRELREFCPNDRSLLAGLLSDSSTTRVLRLLDCGVECIYQCFRNLRLRNGDPVGRIVDTFFVVELSLSL